LKLKTATRINMPKSMLTLMKRQLNNLINGKSKKKLIIYGAGARGIITNEILKLLGHQIIYFVDQKAKTEQSICNGIPILNPNKILYENIEDIFIIVAAYSFQEINKTLTAFGLEPTVHFKNLFSSAIDDGTALAPVYNELDFFLSYSRTIDFPGFEHLICKDTKNKDSPLTILTLGGSTTDPGVVDPFEQENSNKKKESSGSWPKLLHELLNENNIENQIYNGGTGGHCSAQELLKLLRDGLTLRPDLVIVLDGINDGCSILRYKKMYPKYHLHFKKIDNIVNALIKKSNNNKTFSDISYGIASKNTSFLEWSENQRMMKAICNEFGIKYISFLQPSGLHDDNYIQSCDVEFRTGWFLHNFFGSKREEIVKQAERNNLNLNLLLKSFVEDVFSYNIDPNTHFGIRYPDIEQFYALALNFAFSSQYIIPIIDTFYGENEVFCDTVHCTTKGNRLLAKRIFNELESKHLYSK